MRTDEIRWGDRHPPQRGREEREAAQNAACDRVIEAAKAWHDGLNGPNSQQLSQELWRAVDAWIELGDK